MEKFSLDIGNIFIKLINYKQKAMTPLTDDEKMLHENQKVCFICEKEFCVDKNNKKEYKLKCKVRDHCHFTGKYRGVAHSKCNLRYKVPMVFEVVFHNGSSYDNHFVIKQLAKDFNGYFGCIGENTEKYISFSISVFKESGNKKKPDVFTLKFIDSNGFIKGKLEDHVKNLAEPSKNLSIDVLQQRFYNTCRLYPNNNEKFKLLLRKGVYPYEYMGSWKKFNNLVPLDKKYYYSELNLENISDSDLDHVKNVINTFKIDNLGEYHDLYVKSDVALLADVFENFRDKCFKINKLDPAYYLSAPGLSWHSCLKMMGVKLELLTDTEMLLLFEKGIRGGMCNSIHNYAEANNKYMKNYDSSKPSTYLMYVDANNLYGYAMSKRLPIDNFKWETNLTKFTADFIKNYNEGSDIGYLLLVDVAYPKNLRKEHEDLPFLPDKTKINKVTKLTCDLHGKKDYSINIFFLKQALNHGLILERVHKVISFRQDAWLKPYIDMSTRLRINSANDFGKDFYKLCINSVYGKTLENVRKHRDIKIVRSNRKRSVYASEPNYHSTKYISDDLLIMEMKNREVYMNKPVYLGQAILDHSKMLMYEFWYDYVKPKYANDVDSDDDDKIKLCYMDTDSFIFFVKTDDFYKDISNDIDKWFDTSAYSKDIDRPLPKGKNKKVIGKFKDELAGQIMSKCCTLCAKTYSYLVDGFDDDYYEKNKIASKKAKGVKQCIVKNTITFNDYVRILFSDNEKLMRSQRVFGSYCHTSYTEKIEIKKD